ncbi:enamine deaminase RidA [Microbacterium terricola]|uniref:Enamine deaminase RidA n=1 Tax=Microbacterium terricola TaxID=344163 RepID=A0ABM8E3C3_9MICO|nr:enamine deaminase RidA [Microbacterium terricola]
MVRVPSLAHAEYADASIVGAGSEVILLAGVCQLDEDGVVVSPGDVAAQTRAALENMDAVLRRCGAALEDVAFLRILVATDEPNDLGLAWTVVREHFGRHEVPATLQGVSVLGYPNQLVEIEPIATRSPG